MTEYQPLNFRT